VRLLLDTHVLLWVAREPARLNGKARSVLADEDNDLFISPVNVWEIGIKYARGSFPLPAPPDDFIRDMRAKLSLGLLVVTTDDAVAAAELPGIHKDPFDRMLVAQAARRRLVLATADDLVTRYGVPFFWAGRKPPPT